MKKTFKKAVKKEAVSSVVVEEAFATLENYENKKRRSVSEYPEIESRHGITEMDYKSTVGRFETADGTCSSISAATVLAPPFMATVVNGNDDRFFLSQLYGNGIPKPEKLFFFRGGDVYSDVIGGEAKCEFSDDEMEEQRKAGKIAKCATHYYLPIAVGEKIYLLHVTAGSKNVFEDVQKLLRFKVNLSPGQVVEFRNGSGKYTPLSASAITNAPLGDPISFMGQKKKTLSYVLERNEIVRSKAMARIDAIKESIRAQGLAEDHLRDENLEEFSFLFGFLPTGTLEEFKRR